MSGLEVARAARLLDARLPVAIASGFIDETLRSQADEAGVRELIFKADPEAFCDLVMRLLPEQFAATAASSEAPPQ
jgi:CheY-like chemotaxis protein